MMTRAMPMLAVVLLPALAAAQVAVMPVEGTNLSPGEADAIGILIAQEYASASGVAVIGPHDSAAALQAAGSAAAAAAQLGAAEYIEVSAVLLSTKVSVRATLRAAGGAELFSEQMTARSLDDVQQVAERLALALYERVPARATRTIHNVTETEGRVPNRTFVEKVMGLKTAFYVPVAKGQRINKAISLQFDGRLEGESYFLELGAGVVMPTSGADEEANGYGGVFAELGASYYLYDDDISPYVGAGVIPRLVIGFDDGGFQFAPYGQIGVMLMRESSSRIYFDLRVAQVVTPFNKRQYSNDEYGYLDYETVRSTKKIYPTEITFAAGIGW